MAKYWGFEGSLSSKKVTGSVAEPPLFWAAPAPTYLGRLRLQVKRGGSRRLRLHTLKFFILSFQKVNY